MVKGEFVKGENIAHSAGSVLRLTILRWLLRKRGELQQWSLERVGYFRNPGDGEEVGLPQDKNHQSSARHVGHEGNLCGARALFIFQGY